MPDVSEVVLGSVRSPSAKHGPNGTFWYPRQGGIQAIPRAFERSIGSRRIRLNACVTGIDAIRRCVHLAGGHLAGYDRLISTLPLPALIRLLGDAVPVELRGLASLLAHNVVHTVNVGVEGRQPEETSGMHWIYYPGEQVVFHRVSFPGSLSPWMVPDGCYSIQAEVSESAQRPCHRATLIETVLRDLNGQGLIRGRVRTAWMETLDPAYIVYGLTHREVTQPLIAWLSERRIDSRGRFGQWEYLNMDQVILSGKAAAEATA